MGWMMSKSLRMTSYDMTISAIGGHTEELPMADKIRDEQTDYLFKAILSLNDIDECYSFFKDLCTVSEIREMAKRLTAARMLNNNYIYSEIAEQTGLSTATISRVNRCLKYGSDGYAAILPRIERKK